MLYKRVRILREAARPTQVITITCRDQDHSLEKLLRDIQKRGNVGHSFSIIVDPGSGEEGHHGWDGDGSDAIIDIKVENAVPTI